jgi:competence protein ComEC
MKTSTLIVLVSCFALGVVFGSFIDLGRTFPVFLLMLAGAILLFPRLGVSVSRVSFFVTFGLLAFGCGVLRMDIAHMTSTEGVLDNQLGETVRVEGIIVDEPDERDSTMRITVAIEDTTLHTKLTKVLVTTDIYPTYAYGDRLVLNGVLEKPENFLSDTGRSFDYVGYLAKDNIHYQMYRPQIERIGSDEGNPIVASLLSLKFSFLEKVSLVLHEPYSALVGGLVVGAKQSLGENLLDMFRTVGLIHIVVLSGYNVTIIAESLMRVLGVLPRYARVTIGGMSIVGFAIMTGAGATIVRASIMALIVVVGRALGREADMLRLLAIAALMMILHNPMIVVYDPSFQLSFLATLGLILLPPMCEKYFTWMPEKFGLREVALATLTTQIFVLPALVYMMGEVSLVALVVNLLVLMVIPITMLFGFLAGVFGFISHTLSMIFAFFAFLFLYYEIFIVELFARVPFASVTVPHVSLVWVIVVYALYGVVIWRWYAKQTFGHT